MLIACSRCRKIEDKDFKKGEIIKTRYDKIYLCEECHTRFIHFLGELNNKREG